MEIANATRQGGPTGLQLERFTEALEDPESLLTYPALTGHHKQSVRDAERLLSKEMVKFMKKKGYSFETEYIENSIGDHLLMNVALHSFSVAGTTIKC